MLVEIRGRDLPGRLFDEHNNVHVGVQRRGTRAEGRGLLTTEAWAGDSPRPRWEFAVTMAEDGDIRGPHVQGRRGDRFVYLSWVDVAPDGTTTMFRRAKLMLAAVPPEVLGAAGRAGWRLIGEVGLTDPCGEPLCAAVRPPVIAWSAAWPV